MKVSRQFAADFNEVIAFLRQAHPSAWPPDDADALIEEAREAVRRDPDGGVAYYSAQAKALRDTGSLL